MKKMLMLSLFLMIPTVMYGGRLIRIPACTDYDFTSVQAMGYDITSGSRIDGYVDIMVEDAYVEEALVRYPQAKLLPLEWSTLLPNTDEEMGFYHGPNENNAFWATLAEDNDMVDTPASYGTSYEGRDLYYVRMTNAGAGAPAILFTALTHGREPGGNSAVIDFAQWLATEYGSDTMATFILDNAQVYFVPMVNVDAYYYNLPSGGNDQRKNMNFSTPVNSDGIDLNRNFSYMWGYDDSGSSPNPYSATYRGSAALSEPETAALTQWMETINPVGGFHYHTYGGYLLYPYGYNNSATPHEALFSSWGSQLTAQNNYACGRCGQILYDVNGDAVDWSYGTHQYLFYTPEVDDNGFWGSQYDETLLETNNLECRYMNKLLCMNLLSMTGITDEDHLEVGGSGLSVTVGENPVSSVLSYAVSGTGNSSVTILDVSGRIVASPENGSWTIPSSLMNGVYFIRAESGAESVSERFTVLR